MAASNGGLAISVLGPLEVFIGGRPVALRAGRLRALLAMLAMSAGKPVSVDRLGAALWDDAPPANARRSVQTYLARLRTALGADRIGGGPAGYLLLTEPERVDALRFGKLLDAAAQEPDPAAERALVEQALGLWRGSPFDGVRSAWLERAIAPRLQERYLAAVERRIDLDLAERRLGELAPQLYDLTAAHPLRESLWVRLLVVLDRSGRQAEALKQYEQVRARLAEELGTDPGPELRQAHADLLAGGPPQLPVQATPAPAGAPVPRQLPTDIDGFTGRHTELKALHNLAGAAQDQRTGAVTISAVVGTAGIGKTALAIHWAHQVADRFPDGQLYVNLRGFHPTEPATDPAEAVRVFLDALGVAPAHLPVRADAQAGLYRSLLAGKRMLILLDNARDAEQVRPLLPGSPTCMVVVTSRDQLVGLVTAAAAHPLVLDQLPDADAHDLLAHRLGHDRIAAEPAAASAIISRCAGLPLALAVVASRAATHPQFTLDTLVSELRDARSTLDALDTGDPAIDTRAVFSWSYQTLTTGAARLFRLLALHPGHAISMTAAASLAGATVPAVRPPLAELTRAHLLAESHPGRYTCHDLLRNYANELTRDHDSHPDRQAALGRLLDYYLHTAATAAALLNPGREPVTLTPPSPVVASEPLADREQALAWFTTEHHALVTAIHHAARAGFDTHTWQIAWSVANYLDRQARWHDYAATQYAALDATQRLEDRAAQALSHYALGLASSRLGRLDDAHLHQDRALELCRELDDQVGQARAHHGLSLVFEQRGDYLSALRHAEQALELCRSTGHRAGLARTLNTVGWYHALLGDYKHAITYCEQALALHRELADRNSEADTWDSLGHAHLQLGHHRQAITCYQHAVARFRELGNRYQEATTLTNLGEAHLATGDSTVASARWRQALCILDDLKHPDAEQLRARLHQ